MSDTAKFSEHINKVCEKARDMCSWILRTFKCRSPDLMKTLWRSLVLPIMDYCSQLWCPIELSQIKQLEAIQQSFTRKIKTSSPCDYWERLAHFKLYSLERRRERYRILYVWKILESHVPNISCEGNGIQKLHSPRNGRACFISLLSSYILAKIKKLREESLTYHGAQLFNALPKELREITNCSVTVFKNKLDKFLSKIPDQPSVDGYTSGRQAASNSLLSQIPLFCRNLRNMF